ncbi:hypothetical protein B0H11DRAFT_2186176 [Mycena galericulata]|nr:hypothetical protein B0H11DRAFT_2186176 [Mycena galericulata]
MGMYLVVHHPRQVFIDAMTVGSELYTTAGPRRKEFTQSWLWPAGTVRFSAIYSEAVHPEDWVPIFCAPRGTKEGSQKPGKRKLRLGNDRCRRTRMGWKCSPRPFRPSGVAAQGIRSQSSAEANVMENIVRRQRPSQGVESRVTAAISSPGVGRLVRTRQPQYRRKSFVFHQARSVGNRSTNFGNALKSPDLAKAFPNGSNSLDIETIDAGAYNHAVWPLRRDPREEKDKKHE